MRQISLIVARTPDGVIGNNNSLLWNLPYDLMMFKRMTSGCPIIMGRKTHESIGWVLPNRKNIVITRGKHQFDGVTMAKSLEEAIEIASVDYDGQIFIIGGAQIYKEAIDKKLVDTIHETIVHTNLSGDSYFNFNDEDFLLHFDLKREMDDENQYDMTFRVWKKPTTNQLSRDDIKNKYRDHLTVGKLKEFLYKNNLPDDAMVVIQRIEDAYYEKNGWSVYSKFDKIDNALSEYTPAWSCVGYKDEHDILFINLHY